MEEYLGHVRRVSLYAAILGCLAAGGTLAGGQLRPASGLLVGTVASLIYFWLMSYRVLRSAALPPHKAVGYMRGGWLVRLSFITLVLALCTALPGVSFPAVVAGLFVVQAAELLDAAVLAGRGAR